MLIARHSPWSLDVRHHAQANETADTSVELGWQLAVGQAFAPAIESRAAFALAARGGFFIAFPSADIIQNIAGLDLFLELAEGSLHVVILNCY